MLIGTIIGWIVAGFFVGAIARLLVPGKQSMGVAMTIVLGVVGALLGGFIGSALFGPNLAADSTGAYAVQTAWPGWIMAILGGVAVLLAFLAIGGRRDRLT